MTEKDEFLTEADFMAIIEKVQMRTGITDMWTSQIVNDPLPTERQLTRERLTGRPWDEFIP